MTDNSKYSLGTDLYYGNTIKDWSALSRYFRYVYVRSNIGINPDPKFVEYVQKAKAAGMLVGPFLEAWPRLGISGQVRVQRDQVAKSLTTMDLPPVVAYEAQEVADPNKKGRWVSTYPNPADLTVFLQLMPEAVIYLGLNGMGIVKNAGIDYSKWRLWFGRYYEHQGLNGEMGVQDTLQLLLSEFKILPSQVLFIQTANALPYPSTAISDDKGADFDRAVSFVFPGSVPAPTPAPVPAPSPDPMATINNRLANLEQGESNNLIRVGNLEARVYALEHPAPTPIPIPAPGPSSGPSAYPTNVWTLKTLEEAGIPHNGSYASFGGHGRSNAILLRHAETNFMRNLSTNNRLWKWAQAPEGRLYISTDNPDEVWWPVVVMASRPDAIRQMVHVLEERMDQVRIEGFKSNDFYPTFPIEKYPWLYAYAWTANLDGSYGPSHNGLTWIMPLFSPGGGYPIKKGTLDFWIDRALLKERIA